MRIVAALLFLTALLAIGYERISAGAPQNVPPTPSPTLLDDGTCCPSPRP